MPLLGLFTSSVLSQSTQAEPQITAVPSFTEATPSQQIHSISTLPTTFSTPTASTHAWVNILSSADYILDEMNEHLHVDLRKRQGGVAATNLPQATTIATQMSPITTYGPKNGWPQSIYTQLFVAVPDQWPSPQAGTVGLGSIQGQIGVVKTHSKRYIPSQPTGQVLRIKGREVTMS